METEFKVKIITDNFNEEKLIISEEMFHSKLRSLLESTIRDYATDEHNGSLIVDLWDADILKDERDVNEISDFTELTISQTGLQFICSKCGKAVGSLSICDCHKCYDCCDEDNLAPEDLKKVKEHREKTEKIIEARFGKEAVKR